MTPEQRTRLISVARNDQPPDRVLAGGQVLNVLTRELHPADVLVTDGRIAAVLAPSPATEWPSSVDVVDVSGRTLAPGFIDPHVHIESSMLTVSEYARAVLPRGVTTIAADPHEIGNVLGLAGMSLLFEEARTTRLRVLLRVPGRIPAMPDRLETSNAALSHADTEGMFAWPEAVCLAGDINPTLIVRADPEQLAKIAFAERNGRTVSGQSPGLTGRTLNAYVAGGPEDSHVAGSVDEIVENLRLGLRTVLALREGRRLGRLEFAALAERIRRDGLETRFLQLCTDDIHAHFLLSEGSLDHRVRVAIEAGFEVATAYQMATLNPAEGLRIDRDFGSIAPGRHADILVLRDLRRVDIERVFVGGECVAEPGIVRAGAGGFRYPDWARNTVRLRQPISTADLEVRTGNNAPRARVRAITMTSPKHVHEAELDVTGGVVLPNPAADVLALAVADRHSFSGRIGKGFMSGLGIARGALATSISHDAHNLLVTGASHADMALAANRVAAIGGGYAVALEGEIIFELALPIAGLMSEAPAGEVAAAVVALERLLMERLGCKSGAGALLALNFLCLPNIPHFGFTDHGLIDSKALHPVDTVIGFDTGGDAPPA